MNPKRNKKKKLLNKKTLDKIKMKQNLKRLDNIKNNQIFEDEFPLKDALTEFEKDKTSLNNLSIYEDSKPEKEKISPQNEQSSEAISDIKNLSKTNSDTKYNNLEEFESDIKDKNLTDITFSEKKENNDLDLIKQPSDINRETENDKKSLYPDKTSNLLQNNNKLSKIPELNEKNISKEKAIEDKKLKIEEECLDKNKSLKKQITISQPQGLGYSLELDLKSKKLEIIKLQKKTKDLKEELELTRKLNLSKMIEIDIVKEESQSLELILKKERRQIQKFFTLAMQSNLILINIIDEFSNDTLENLKFLL